MLPLALSAFHASSRKSGPLAAGGAILFVSLRLIVYEYLSAVRADLGHKARFLYVYIVVAGAALDDLLCENKGGRRVDGTALRTFDSKFSHV